MQTRLTNDELGRQLRDDSSLFLARRRTITSLALFSCAVLGGIALFQIGILKKLPKLPWRIFDAEKIHASAQAYSIADTPDALLGLTSYAITACLAGMGPENRSQTHPWMPLGMGLKLLADTALAVKLTSDAWLKYRALSPWSVLTGMATLTSLAMALPEATAAQRRLTGNEHA